MGRFVANQQAIDRLDRLPGVLAILGHHAADVADEARRIAPVATGAYRDSIEPDVGIDERGPVGRVNAHDFKSHWIEFGTLSRTPLAVLRRALDSRTRSRL